ncbi:DUF58 domain-containing protein [Oceanobacillus manasiensis]|uniref:DUF58 domain-containing protein n=1 Tax=Oceanobacillus manasiensis TaxID=586413 RepID=UPI0005A9506A|nr:DUF58 domain-containing protein [Oceanobacillus manasiensis]
MKWQRDHTIEGKAGYDYVLVAIILLAIIGVVMNNTIPFLGVGAVTAYLIVFKWYDSGIGKSVSLENPTRSIKLFPDETFDLTLDIENRSIYPMINGEFQLQIGPAVKAFKHAQENKNYWHQIKIPLSILRKRKAHLTIPIVAQQRGVAKINNIMYYFPHLFHFNSTLIRYMPFYRTEFVVFPRLIEVKGAEAVFQMLPGKGRSPFSPYEDIQSPLGTREYHYSDPFHRINWNASVKTQKLQTNVYEREIDQSFLFLVNIGKSKTTNMVQTNQHMEALLSYTAYLSKIATEKDIPFELFINTRRPGKVPVLHVPEGEGKRHYGTTMEMLARIHKQSLVFPFDKMLFNLGNQVTQQKTCIIIGELTEDSMNILNKWKNKNVNIFHVPYTEGISKVKPLGQEVFSHAE